MINRITDLSKSRYCKGIQCPKMLWLDAYKPQEAEDILPESVLANGTLVGDLARSYFGEYSLVDFSFDKTEMVNKTNELNPVRKTLLRRHLSTTGFTALWTFSTETATAGTLSRSKARPRYTRYTLKTWRSSIIF